MTASVLICIAVCTFRRDSLAATLACLAAMRAPAEAQIAIVVADNDKDPSAQQRVAQAPTTWPVDYVHAPARNISIARNACLTHARNLRADWLAFIDDDEIAGPDWLDQLYTTAQETHADMVFGPVRALYPVDAPDWMQTLNLHSSLPELRPGTDRQTGHTSNALLRLAPEWADLVFDLSRGRTGGEDTAFFFAVADRGGRAAISSAEVTEAVTPARLRFDWLGKRRFRMGQSYAVSAHGISARGQLAASALAKAVYCGMRALLVVPRTAPRNFWALRGLMHLGVVAGCARLPEPELYGQSDTPQ